MRLKANPTESINRDRPITFYWNGKPLPAYEGDVLASALLANGVRRVGASFKYGRPRGIYTAWSDEPNAIVSLESGGLLTPNARATEAEVYDGMNARAASGGGGGGRGKDLLGMWNLNLKSLFRPLHGAMPAGFYYKTFQSPQFLWPVYEKVLRRFAGFSMPPAVEDKKSYDTEHHHCDVLIVGGGVAGLTAARSLANSGLSVILADDRPHLGGQWWTDAEAELDGMPVYEWVQDSEQAIRKTCKLLKRTVAYALHDHNLVLAAERIQDHLSPGQRNPARPRQRHHRIRAKEIILATGAYERGVAFANNDLPGVMLANAVQAYLKLYSVLPGENVLLFVNNDGGYALARDLHAAGCKKITVADARPKGSPPLPEGIKFLSGYVPLQAQSRGGRLSGVRMQKIANDGRQTAGIADVDVACDLFALSCGYDPIVHLTCHKTNRPVWSEELACFLPGDSSEESCHLAGAVCGYFRADAAKQSGMRAAQFAAKQLNTEISGKLPNSARPAMPKRDNFGIAPLFVTEGGGGKRFVDLQNDVTADDLELALRENYRSIEHVKRYTAMGFGTDQGKTSNVIGFNYVAEKLGVNVREVGTTTYRPPYTPVAFGVLAGQHVRGLYDPIRYTPMQQSHIKSNPEFERVGQWMRPRYFPQAGEDMQQALNRECLAARQAVAVIDASTLGKIDVRGPDAREFLNRVYTNSWTKLAPGKCRYGIMLDENGMVYDDGVTACITDEHFYLTTTTPGAAPVYQWLEDWLQTEWPDLRVFLTSVTDHWSTTAVVGPHSRALLAKVCSDINFSREDFDFMEWKEGTVCDVPARVMRISFSGELAYEINVQSNYGRHIWDSVCAAGEEFGITRYGTETMHVLRAEKGFIIVGQDTDGFVTPTDLGMDWILPKKKPFSYLGKRSLSRPEMLREERKQLVGLFPKDRRKIMPEGCQLVNSRKTSDDMQGHVTSSYYSPILKRSFALALVKRGLKRQGETLFGMTKEGELIETEITDSIVYDKKGEKRDG